MFGSSKKPTTGTFVGLTPKAPDVLPDNKSAVLKFPITVSTFTVKLFVTVSKTLVDAPVLACTKTSFATRSTGFVNEIVVVVSGRLLIYKFTSLPIVTAGSELKSAGTLTTNLRESIGSVFPKGPGEPWNDSVCIKLFKTFSLLCTFVW